MMFSAIIPYKRSYSAMLFIKTTDTPLVYSKRSFRTILDFFQFSNDYRR